jgi:hypothetical protein
MSVARAAMVTVDEFSRLVSGIHAAALRGCVAIGRDEMRSVLNWLDPSASPEITIGVGNPSLQS